MQGLCANWEPHLNCLLPPEFTEQGQSAHFPVLWTLLTQAQQNQALFFCKGSIWFQVIKEKPRTHCWLFDKHPGGCSEGTVSQSPPCNYKGTCPSTQPFQSPHLPGQPWPSLMGAVLHKTPVLLPHCWTPAEGWNKMITSRSHTHIAYMSPRHVGGEWGEKRHWRKTSTKKWKESSERTGIEKYMTPTREWEKRKMADTVNSLPTIYCPFFLGAILFREDNKTSPG